MTSAATTLRTRVLRSYISLLRARKIICGEDVEGSQRALQKIREEYEKQRHVTDPKEIEKLVEIAEQAREYALKTIIQGVLNERGAIELRIRPENLIKNKEPDLDF